MKFKADSRRVYATARNFKEGDIVLWKEEYSRGRAVGVIWRRAVGFDQHGVYGEHVQVRWIAHAGSVMWYESHELDLYDGA